MAARGPEVAELGHGRFQQRHRSRVVVLLDDRLAEPRDRVGQRDAVTELAAEGDGLLGVSFAAPRVGGPTGCGGRGLEEVRLLGRLGRHRDRLEQESRGLAVRTQGGSALCGRAQRDPRLGRERLGLVRRPRVGVRREVLAGERARELLAAEPLEVARGREVAGLAIVAREHVVGDFADQALHEDVLAALRRPRICLDPQELAPDEALAGGPRARPRAGRRHPASAATVKL